MLALGATGGSTAIAADPDNEWYELSSDLSSLARLMGAVMARYEMERDKYIFSPHVLDTWDDLEKLVNEINEILKSMADE